MDAGIRMCIGGRGDRSGDLGGRAGGKALGDPTRRSGRERRARREEWLRGVKLSMLETVLHKKNLCLLKYFR